MAETLSVLASEFAHDANNLVLQILGANELLGTQLGSPLATQAELDQISLYAHNVTTIAHDLEELLERSRPKAD